MNILAIETATTACAVGLRTKDGSEVGWVVDDTRHHTETLTSALSRLLAQAGLRARDLDRVVVDHGPGLFTGLRVGLATALGLAQGVGCALVQVTSLELLAWGAQEAGVRGTLLAAVDARRGEVFSQVFDLAEDVVVSGPPLVTTARALAIEWATSGAPVTFSGDGVERYLSDFSAVPQARLERQLVPSVSAALAIARNREPVEHVEALYLREADAVANFSTRQRS